MLNSSHVLYLYGTKWVQYIYYSKAYTWDFTIVLVNILILRNFVREKNFALFLTVLFKIVLYCEQQDVTEILKNLEESI